MSPSLFYISFNICIHSLLPVQLFLFVLLSFFSLLLHEDHYSNTTLFRISQLPWEILHFRICSHGIMLIYSWHFWICAPKTQDILPFLRNNDQSIILQLFLKVLAYISSIFLSHFVPKKTHIGENMQNKSWERWQQNEA